MNSALSYSNTLKPFILNGSECLEFHVAFETLRLPNGDPVQVGKKGALPTTLHLRRRQAGKVGDRGVSPIIATILLVAITVVIAAVLYVIVSGYLTNSSSPPQEVALQDVTFSHTGNPATAYYITFGQVSSTSGVTTADFGFKIVNPVYNSVVNFISVVIISPRGVTLAHYTPGAASWNNTITFPQGDEVQFDTGLQNLQGSGDIVQVFGLTSHSVSGGYSVGL